MLTLKRQRPKMFKRIVLSKMYPRLIILTLFLTTNAQQRINSKMTEMFRWRQVDFQFPNENIRNSLIASRRYIQANNSMLGLEVWQDKMFITVPRWYAGVGSTLNYVNLDSRTKSPLLIPYPDYESNDIHNGNIHDKIISTTRVFVDTCNRLWVPDNGKEGLSTGSPIVLSSHKLFIFDLNTNKLIRKVTISDDVKTDLSLFYEVVADCSTDCYKSHAYIADTIGYGLLVYSWETNTLRRISNSYLFFEPQSSVFNLAQFSDGIMGMALSPVNKDGFRTFYFHALASYNEYNVSTQVLQDPNLSFDFTRFRLMGNRGERSQSTTQRMDEKTGVLFYTQVLKNGIGCWNSKLNPSEYSTATNGMATVDRERISFPSALTLDAQRNVWVLSNNLLSFGSSNFNARDYNYRVFNASVEILIKDTVCDVNSLESSGVGQIWT